MTISRGRRAPCARVTRRATLAGACERRCSRAGPGRALLRGVAGADGAGSTRGGSAASCWAASTTAGCTRCCYSGANLVPVATTAAARARLRRPAAGRQGRRCSSIVGPADEVLDCGGCSSRRGARPARSAPTSRCMVIDRDPPSSPDPLVRRVRRRRARPPRAGLHRHVHRGGRCLARWPAGRRRAVPRPRRRDRARRALVRADRGRHAWCSRPRSVRSAGGAARCRASGSTRRTAAAGSPRRAWPRWSARRGAIAPAV